MQQQFTERGNNMGSLMAGWASHFQDQKTVDLERNKSHTKEEIENFHRRKKASKHQHQQHDKVARPQSSFKSSPQFIFHWGRCPVDVEKACKICDWWTQSNLAFLNEPPQEKLMPASNYAAQFHVANKCASAN